MADPLFSISNISCTSLSSQKSKKSISSPISIKPRPLKLLQKQRKVEQAHKPDTQSGITPSRVPNPPYAGGAKDAFFQAGGGREVPAGLRRAAADRNVKSREGEDGDERGDESEKGDRSPPPREYQGRAAMPGNNFGLRDVVEIGRVYWRTWDEGFWAY